MPDLPRALLVASGDMAEVEHVAMASKATAPGREVWILVGDHQKVTAPVIATVLAALELDSHHRLIWPGFMPPRPAGLFVGSDRSLRHGRGRTFPPWALAETRRLSEVLLADHGAYLERLLRAIRGRPRDVLSPIPPGFVLTDDDGLMGMADEPPRLKPDLAAAPRHLRWDQEVQVNYARDRYMMHLSREQLAQRVVDIMGNLHTIDSKGRVSADVQNPGHILWQALLAEVVGEMTIRHGQYPAGWGHGFLAGATWPGSLTFHKRIENPVPGELRARCGSSQVVVKYGQRRYLQPLLDSGSLRLAPASLYSDPSLDPARKDDELVQEFSVGAFALGRVAGLPASLVRRSRLRKSVRMELGTNYYVLCLSRVLTRRLLYDFDADCCLVVSDPGAFESRLRRAAAFDLPGWELLSGPVEYYDPLQVSEIEVKPVFWKHFRYAYQREYRFALVPPEAVPVLDPIEVSLGSLRDIAEVCELDSV